MKTSQIIAASVLAFLFVAWGGISLYLYCRRMGRRGMPKPGTTWENKLTGDKFVVEQPVTTHDNKPVCPVVRRGFISVVWPKETFKDHFK